MEERTGSRHTKHVSETGVLVRALKLKAGLDSQSKSTIVNIATVEETRKVQDWFAEEDDGSPRRYG